MSVVEVKKLRVSNDVSVSDLTLSQKKLLVGWLSAVVENHDKPFRVLADRERVAVLPKPNADLSVESFAAMLHKADLSSQISYHLSSMILVSATGAQERPMIEIASIDRLALNTLQGHALETVASEPPANDADNQAAPSMTMPSVISRHFSRFSSEMQAFVVDALKQHGSRGAGFFQRTSSVDIPNIPVSLPNQDMFGGQIYNLVELLANPQTRGGKFIDPITSKHYFLSELSPAATEASKSLQPENTSPSNSLAGGG